jgi:hypothetical protein
MMLSNQRLACSQKIVSRELDVTLQALPIHYYIG